MLFGIIIFLLIGVIVYFHVVQGLFSAGLSAVIAVISAVLAVGLHEWVIAMLLKGKFADQAVAFTLTGLFAIVYLILRVIFDRLIPGNVRFPFLADKIGSAAFGLVAGICAAGTLAIAVQSLPLPSSIAGYERYTMEEKKTDIRTMADKPPLAAVFQQMKDEGRFRGRNQGQGLFIPADDLVLSIVDKVSSRDGALAVGHPFSETHPDYLQELFGQRLTQLGSKHTATPDRTQLLGVYTAPAFATDDQETFVLNDLPTGIRGGKEQGLGQMRPPTEGKLYLIARVRFSADDVDEKTGVFSFSPASVRLVANGTNYFPVGTLQNLSVLYLNAVDDYLFCPSNKGADLVFEVDELAFRNQAGQVNIPSGTFMEVKRMSRIPLGGTQVLSIAQTKPDPENIAVIRRQGSRPAKRKDK